MHTRLIFLAAIFFTSTAFAQQSAIVLTSEAFKEVEVVNEAGQKEFKLVAPGTVVPRDEIVYVTTFENRGDQPATNIVITNPVPNDSIYKAGSAFGSGTTITYSVDGGQTYDAPAALRVTGEDGQPRTATAEDYTHIRWVYTQSLQPGATGNVTFRTIIR